MNLKKQAGVAILISDKIDFKPKLVRRDREGHYIFIKEKEQQKETAVLHSYSPNTKTLNLVKKKHYYI